MKYLSQSLSFAMFTLLPFFHALWAMNDTPCYDEQRSKELSNYVLVQISKYRDYRDPNSGEVIKEYLRLGADPNFLANWYKNGSRAIHLAAENNDCDLLLFLVKHGADIEAKNDLGQTPLHAAAWKGSRDALVLLLRLGANINLKDGNGCTALTVSSMMLHKESVDTLLNFGASLDYSDKSKMLEPFLSPLTMLPEEPWQHSVLRLKQNKVLSHFLSETSPDLVKQLVSKLYEARTILDTALVTRNEEAILMLLPHADPLGGLYNGVFLARHVTEWTKIEGKPSMYEQILSVPMNHFLAIFLALREELPPDIYDYIIKIIFSLGSDAPRDPMAIE